MNYNPEKQHRRSIRLRGYDYTREGAYYFTIWCHQKRCLLVEIKDGFMHLNLVGATAKAVWDSLPRHFPLIELDAFVFMPNHVHGIIVITDSAGNCNLKRNCRAKHSYQNITTHPKNLYPRMLTLVPRYRSANAFPGCKTHHYLAAQNPVQ
jgi:REP element-mobilizing transposase RayT